MIRGIHYFSTELKTKIDVIPMGCFKIHSYIAQGAIAVKYVYINFGNYITLFDS